RLGALFQQRLHAGLHRIDEELLARWEAHRQRVEPRGAERVAAAPMARGRRLEIDQQAADDGFGHGEAQWRSTGTTTIPPPGARAGVRVFSCSAAFRAPVSTPWRRARARRRSAPTTAARGAAPRRVAAAPRRVPPQ